jgi:aspartate/methionine/tyrosine aminotransferase
MRDAVPQAFGLRPPGSVRRRIGNAVHGQGRTSVFEEISRLAMTSGGINLGQGFPEGLEPPELIEAAALALQRGPHQYPPMHGLPALRQAVAESNFRFHGIPTDWESEVLVTAGATEALASCFLGLLDTGDEVILLEPAYDSYPNMIRRAGGVPVPVRLEAPLWELPRERLAAAITPRARAIVLNTPMNPNGKIFDNDELAFLAALLERHDLLAICDEVYEHLVFEGARHRSLMELPDARARCLRIGSAGKTFSVTGWKVGYITAPQALLAPVARAHQYLTFTVPPALQTAVAYGLRLSDDYFGSLRARLQDRRNHLVSGLSAIGFDLLTCPATYFLCADLSRSHPGTDDIAFCRAMLQQAGVAAIPVSAFYSEPETSRLIRFCFAKHRETLDAAVARLQMRAIALFDGLLSSVFDVLPTSASRLL